MLNVTKELTALARKLGYTGKAPDTVAKAINAITASVGEGGGEGGGSNGPLILTVEEYDPATHDDLIGQETLDYIRDETAKIENVLTGATAEYIYENPIFIICYEFKGELAKTSVSYEMHERDEFYILTIFPYGGGLEDGNYIAIGNNCFVSYSEDFTPIGDE